MWTLPFLAFRSANPLIMCLRDHVFYLIIRLTRQKIVDTFLRPISMMVQPAFHYPFYLFKLPIQSLLKDVTMQPFVWQKCETKIFDTPLTLNLMTYEQ
jgi:hypothetical protein